MSELLFWGFNASLMAVDTGIDIVASKDNLYHHLQVKTAARKDDGKFSFSIKSASFDVHDKNNTYYVFLMRYGNNNIYAVVPSSFLEVQRKVNVIKDNGVSLSLTISPDPRGKHYTLNGKANLTPFINNFGQIR